MTVIVSKTDWNGVRVIPENHDTGDALFMQRKAKQHWFRAVDRGVTIGCACWFKCGKDRGRLSNLWVHPDYRGQGIAQRLVVARELDAKKQGIRVMETRTKSKLHTFRGYRLIRQFKVYTLFEKELT